MSRVLYNDNDITAYFGIINYSINATTTHITESDIKELKEVAPNSSLDTSSFSSTYQTTYWRAYVFFKESDFSEGSDIRVSVTESVPTSYVFNSAMGHTYKTTYNNETYVYLGFSANMTGTSRINYHIANDSGYENVLPKTFDGGTFTYDNYFQYLYNPNGYENVIPLIVTVTRTDGGTISVNDSLVYVDDGDTYTRHPSNIVSGTTSYTFPSITAKKLSSVSFTPYVKSVSFTISTTHMTNCTVDNPTITVDTPFTLTLTANNGYIFSSDDIPYLSIPISLGSRTSNFTISSDGKTATLTDTITSDEIGTATQVQLSVYANAILSSEIPTTSYSFVNINTITDDNLKELAKYRFHVADSSNPYNIVDLGEYISSLKRFYCDIPTSETSNIVLGNIDTSISCGIVSSDFITLDCGSVTIESTNNNSNDYDNTIYAILPFIGNTSLDANLVMNRTLHMYYRVSTISGECICFIESDDIPLYTFYGNIAENVPYILNNILWELKGDFSNQSCVLYGFVPKIIIVYNDNYNESGLYNDEKYGVIGDIASGLCEIGDIILSNENINNDEYDRIITELQNGIIFD